ncbi:hypothetical protein IKF57_00930 [Candidatus Saccharibacteria bacterium]|nr:hypothetical protein [Candidatus Saccharibacteria bacterium]
MIDIHSHILPGVDDGARDFDDSLKMLRELEKNRITHVICTPHYIDATNYSSPAAENRKIFRELKAKAKEASINVKLYLGNEIYLTENLFALIKTGKIIPLNDSSFLLIELPLSGEYSNYESIFKLLIRAGWHVVLAHPERYRSLQKNYDLALDLRNSGVHFQCDLGSLLGQYGASAKKLVKRLAKDHLIFAFGSDIHRAHLERPDRWHKAVVKLLDYYKPDELEQLLDKNALVMLH